MPMLSPQKRRAHERRARAARRVVDSGLRPILVSADDGSTVIWVRPEVERAIKELNTHPRVRVRVHFKGDAKAASIEDRSIT